MSINKIKNTIDKNRLSKTNQTTRFKFSDSMMVRNLEQIKSITGPLQLLGIEGFFYMRIYPDNSLIDFTSEPQWGELFFHNLYNENYRTVDLYQHLCFKNNISLWAHNPHNTIWQEGKEYFNLGNGVSIFKQHSSYTNIYSFYSKSNNYKINNFYINNLDILDNFIKYFDDSAATIIDIESQNALILPTYYKNAQEKKPSEEHKTLQTFLSKISSGKVTKDKIISFQQLTPRQQECLGWLCMGKTAEEIGIILGCSQRTIETHICNIKIKFECTKITQIIYLAIKHGLIAK